MSPTDNAIDEALADLAGRSAVLARLFDRHGPYEPRRAAAPDVFASLAKAIVYQQLAGKAAAAIHRRFAALVEGPLTADKVLALDPATIRGAGLSGAKRDAVVDLARHAVDGQLDLESLEALDDPALIQSLCRVRGVGPWTAQMFLLFELGRLDVWPTGDLGLAKRLHRIRATTLLVWGDCDQVVPARYAARFARGIRGDVKIKQIDGAGHTAELDRPQQVAQAITDFLD